MSAAQRLAANTSARARRLENASGREHESLERRAAFVSALFCCSPAVAGADTGETGSAHVLLTPLTLHEGHLAALAQLDSVAAREADGGAGTDALVERRIRSVRYRDQRVWIGYQPRSELLAAIANQTSIFHSVDSNINDNTAFFEVFTCNHVGSTNGNHNNISDFC